jgi:glycosyltransferase involved in cell wall biosynthesis
VTIYQPESVGGAARVAYELAQQFSTAHETAIICTAERTGFRWANGLLMLGIESTGNRTVPVPVLSAANVKTIIDFMDAYDPDVVHAHDLVGVAQLAQIWAQLHAIPFVYTAHALSKEVLAFGGAELLGLLRNEIAESVVHRHLASFHRHCDAIIALNRLAAQDLIDFGYHGRIILIPNGRFLGRYANGTVASLADERIVLLYTGSISERKNQVYLLDVLSYLPPRYVLRLVGEPLDPDYGQQLAVRIAALGLESRVELVGQVPPKQVPAELASAHVFVSASKIEVQSLAVIEALASGKPVVGLGNETVDELVFEHVGCRLSPKTPALRFAEEVRRLCERPQSEYEALCSAARQRVAHLDWANVMTETANAYQLLRQIKAEEAQRESPVSAVGLRQGTLSRRERWARAWRWLNRVVRQPWLFAGLAMMISMAWKLYERSRRRLSRFKEIVAGHLQVPGT